MTTSTFRKSPRFLIVTVIVLSAVVMWLVIGRAMQAASAQAIGANTSFRNFEAPQVHPLTITPDGKHLLAVNTPNATLSVFELSGGSPILTAEIPVGLQPVSVAARTNREVWVVNWLSDSVSIVDLTTGNVRQTIDVGDEPTDVVFAGVGSQRAFVCVSGGGHQTIDGIPVTGASGAIKVFDPANLSAAPQVIEIFAKQPRALARDASGAQVFVSVFESGNQTTLVPQPLVAENGGLPAPNPAMRSGLPAAPNTALIVRWNGSAWADETGNTSWDQFVTYTLADIDLVAIDARTANPTVTARLRNLGTNLGNMTFDPTTGRLFLANMDSGNVVRFEPNLRGRFQAIRVSVLNTSPGAVPSVVSVNDMNPHVNLNDPAGTDAERAQSLALPADITRASDGTIYLAATSSAKVGFLNSAGAVVGRIPVGQGPTGLALDEGRQRLYVLNRFDQSVSLVDTATKSEVGQVSIGLNPEPPAVRYGRRFLYDAVNFSAHGTVSCASCHPSGHRDGLAWDLGDPTGDMVTVGNFTHHPMKGPMMVQSLRGLLQSSPLHWRADRNNFGEFNIAFTGLLGSKRLLTTDEMNAYQTFIETIVYPPNPNENLDRTFPNHPGGPNAAAGFDRFRSFRGLTNIFLGNASNCNACHTTAPAVANRFSTGTSRLVFNGSILSEPQAFKAPQLRGIYQKLGLLKPAPGQPRSEQLTGFGLMHDGAIDTLLNFMRQPDFIGFHNDEERREIEAFLMAFDSVIAPAVGLQVTVNASNKNSPDVLARVNLLIQQAQLIPISGSNFSAPNCDLVVHGIYFGAPRSFLQLGNGIFQPDSGSEATVTLQQLFAAVGDGAELTFTGVPEGEGRRYSIDRNLDGVLNNDEQQISVSLTGRVVDANGNGLSGVNVVLSGAQSASAITDASGDYTFNFISTSATHVVTPQANGVNFTPVSRTFASPKWNASGIFVASPTANVADASPFFVEQHYRDFLNREADAAGLSFWVDQIESCGTDVQCREVRRINVSAAFFLSIEFKESGFLVYRTAKASFGNLPGKPVPLTQAQLMKDSQRISRGVVVNVGNWAALLETNKQAFFLGWVQRPEFLARYPVGMNPAALVDALNANTGGSLTQSERDAFVAQLNAGNTTAVRASIVRQISENAEFSRRELNPAFVAMQYFGYLQRDSDALPDLDFSGYNFWLAKLNQFNGNFVEAEMVKSFITSPEYRHRFGPQ